VSDPFKIPYSFLNRDYNSIDGRPVGTQVEVNKRWYKKQNDNRYYLFIKIDINVAKKSLRKLKKNLA
tara:strand:+ start:619 stop:819 length:201 start_codon:yes stop_codon:yes gene_type:complete